jgi:hypothetical protein
MKNLFGNIASELLEVLMWLDLVVCAVIGYHVGNGMNDHYLIGIILGVLCGGILNVYTYVLFALPIETRDYVKRIAESDELTEIRNYMKEIAEKKTVVPVVTPKAVPVAAPAVASATIPTESAKKDVPEKLNADFLR